jgi:hypothetical protein
VSGVMRLVWLPPRRPFVCIVAWLELMGRHLGGSDSLSSMIRGSWRERFNSPVVGNVGCGSLRGYAG